MVHFYRNVFSHVPKGKVGDVARMLKAIHAQEDRRSAQDKIREVIAKLKAMRLSKAAELVEAKAHETLTYLACEEVLDAYLFEDLTQVREISHEWLSGYNEERPRDALGSLPPALYLQRVRAAQSSISEPST